jgi:hypothetical protein
MTLDIQVGSKVRVKGLRKPVVITRIREEGNDSNRSFVVDFSDFRNGGTRTVSTERIVAVVDE